MNSYYLTSFARGLLFCLFPILFLSISFSFYLPSFVIPWIFAWFSSLLIRFYLKNRIFSAFIHLLVFYIVSYFSLFSFEVIDIYPGISSLSVLILYEYFESFFSKYKKLSNKIYETGLFESLIRPHFFFNVLNSVSSLLPYNSDAHKSLNLVSDLIREIFQRKDIFVTYDVERDFVDKYLKLEYLRLEERLKCFWDVEDSVEDLNPLMPSFLLQPLIENAIKHGIEQTTGEINIHIYKKHKYLYIDISNPYVINDNHHGLGLAISDLKNRLSLLYDDQAQLNINFNNGIFNASLYIPWQVK